MEPERGFADAITLDQLQVLVAVVDTGTFSGAARQLHRTQGVVSYHVAGLEAQLDLVLFDRSGRRPVLTPQGRAVVTRAREVLKRVGNVRRTAWGLRDGLEPRVSLAMDVMFPGPTLARVLADFVDAFPTVGLSVTTGILNSTLEQLDDGRAQIATTGISDVGPRYQAVRCGQVALIPVVAPHHPLAAAATPIVDEALDEHVHVTLSRGDPNDDSWALGFDSAARWGVTDQSVRLDLILGGLGWSRMPRHMVDSHLAAGRLVHLDTERWGLEPVLLQMYALFERDAPPGPAGRWLLDRLVAASNA